MHRFEGHHCASPFAPYFLVGGKWRIHAGDPVEIVGLPTAKEVCPVPEKGQFPLGMRGDEGDTKW